MVHSSCTHWAASALRRQPRSHVKSAQSAAKLWAARRGVRSRKGVRVQGWNACAGQRQQGTPEGGLAGLVAL